MPKKKEISLDMHPFADVAFLLVTFFLLATVMKSYKPVVVEKPNSHAEQKLKDKNMLTITVSDDSRVFLGVTGQENRRRLIANADENFAIDLNTEAVNNFALTSSFGVPISDLKNFFNKDRQERQEMTQPGIPIDSTNNELWYWIREAKKINPDYNIAIEGDLDVRYGEVRNIIDLLVSNGYNELNLITELQSPEENE
jgi:biopolymer transport protein ExbD